MPRKNKRKIYTTGKEAVFVYGAENAGFKPECAGCAFAGDGFVCKTSDGTCLKTKAGEPEQREAGNAKRQR